jgi:hypothetical protein
MNMVTKRRETSLRGMVVSKKQRLDRRMTIRKIGTTVATFAVAVLALVSALTVAIGALSSAFVYAYAQTLSPSPPTHH